ncbi:MAG: MBL fold metallo-hydrolase [Microgenomates group bacterium]
MTKLTFLGTGSSGGVKGVGKSRRRETSALIQTECGNVLIDVTRDFAKQARETAGVEVVMLTHGHADASGGVAQLWEWMRKKGRESIFLYAERKTIEVIKRRFARVDHLIFREIKPGKMFMVWDTEILPFRVKHALTKGFPTLGYAFKFEGKGSLAYASDVGEWDGRAEKILSGATTLVIDGAMWQKRMAAHQTIKELLPRVCRWKNKRILFTQIGKEVPDHEEANRAIKRLCPKAGLAYDGMEVRL